MDFSKKWLKFLLHFFKKIKILRKIKIPNPTYLSSPNSLLLSILYQYTPFSQSKSSYGAKKSKNVKKRHFTPIFAPKVPHIMFFRKNVTRVFALSQKVSGGLAKFQRDLTYSFRELDFFCKKRIKGKCSFEPTGPLPLSLLNAKAGRGGHLAQSGTSGLILVFSFFWNQKRVSSSIDILSSSKYVDFYAFPFAVRPSGANANAQLISPGENFLKKNSDKF